MIKEHTLALVYSYKPLTTIILRQIAPETGTKPAALLSMVVAHEVAHLTTLLKELGSSPIRNLL